MTDKPLDNTDFRPLFTCTHKILYCWPENNSKSLVGCLLSLDAAYLGLKSLFIKKVLLLGEVTLGATFPLVYVNTAVYPINFLQGKTLWHSGATVPNFTRIQRLALQL